MSKRKFETQTQTDTPSKKRKTTTQGYIQHKTSLHSSHGYINFTMNRAQAFEILVERIQDKTIQQILQPALDKAMETTEFKDYLSKFTIDPRIHPPISPHLKPFVAYLNYDINKQRINNGWSHPNVFEAITHTKGLELKRWKLNKNDELIPYSNIEKEDKTQTLQEKKGSLDLVMLENNQFDLIQFVGYDDDQPTPPISPIATSTTIPPKTKDNRTPFETAVDTLAYLLETSTAGCSSVLSVGNSLMISDNNINNKTKEIQKDNQQIKYINNIMCYCSKLASGNATALDRINIINTICNQKFKAEEKGYIVNSFSKNELKSIVSLFEEASLSTASGESVSISLDDHKNKIHHSKQKVVAAIQIANKAFRRLARLEKIILSNNKLIAGSKQSTEMNNLISAFSSYHDDIRFIKLSQFGAAKYSDRQWMLNNNPGIAILATQHPKWTIHAEQTAVDFLLVTRLITSDKNTHNKSYYIGISKPCCPNCNGIIDQFNTSLGTEIIKRSGKHSIITKDETWTDPIFLMSPAGKIINRKTGGIIYEYVTDYELGLHFAEEFKIAGYCITDNKQTEMIENLTPEIIKRLTTEKKEIFLYRDHKLVEQLRAGYKPLKKANTNKKNPDEPRHMSPLTPDTSSQSEAISNVTSLLSQAQNILLEKKTSLNKTEIDSYREQITTLSNQINELSPEVKEKPQQTTTYIDNPYGTFFPSSSQQSSPTSASLKENKDPLDYYSDKFTLSIGNNALYFTIIPNAKISNFKYFIQDFKDKFGEKSIAEIEVINPDNEQRLNMMTTSLLHLQRKNVTEKLTDPEKKELEKLPRKIEDLEKTIGSNASLTLEIDENYIEKITEYFQDSQFTVQSPSSKLG